MLKGKEEPELIALRMRVQERFAKWPLAARDRGAAAMENMGKGSIVLARR
jgi:hypothetical protein